ncbi:lipocalin family protein [Mucilaginibacter gynuensis]|uniref:Lipocalin family protein n=1 Tax=Mucilaginibacter gynuensis TaxID=1302236 RepID=A0ABP8FPX3_9SPHI
MKKDKWLIALAAGVGTAGLIYAFWPKNKIPGNAIVQPFDKNKYLGLWHEIARLPNHIERNLKDVTENYTLNADGTINVVTRAYNFEKNKPVEATGKMKLAGAHNKGRLKVAYHLPIYLNYNILDVDAGYQYALVAGNSMDHLWILSRETTIPDEIKEHFLEKAAGLGFNTTLLEWM